MNTRILRIALTVLATLLAGSAPVADTVTGVADVPGVPSIGSERGVPLSPSEIEAAAAAVPTVVQSPDETDPTATPSASLVFTGMTQLSVPAESFIYKPPDTHIAVGPGAGASGRVVMVTNTGVQIFDKTGATVAGPVDLDAFGTALGLAGLSGLGSVNLCFDPKVIYDQFSGRFFIVILDGKTPNPGGRSNVIICTSTTSAPGTLTAADWTAESASALVSIGGTEAWFDYPGIGVDATRLVVTGNMFSAGGASLGTTLRIFDKSSLTDNGTPPGAVFNDIVLDAAVTSGIFTVQPCQNFGVTPNTDFYCVNRFGSGAYRLWQITGPGGSASLVPGSPSLHAWTAGTQITGGAGSHATQPLNGSGDEFTIDTLSSRVMNTVYRNTGGAAGATDSIWGCLSSDTDADGRSEVFWFRIDPNSSGSVIPGVATTPILLETGSINEDPGDWVYMPSITVNDLGNALICFSESSSALSPNMRIATKHSTETGVFQASVSVASSPALGEYDDFGSDPTRPERWGDYSAAVVDPDDDETFWVAQEVVQSAATGLGNDARWGTRIARVPGVFVPVELSVFTSD